MELPAHMKPAHFGFEFAEAHYERSEQPVSMTDTLLSIGIRLLYP